jgi:hypothetical protein
MKSKLLFFVTVLFILTACKMENTPTEYFDRTALNSNLLFPFGEPYFKDLRLRKMPDLPIIENNKTKIGADSYAQ